jgi:GMP synthase-like glutamine amidotransferase
MSNNKNPLLIIQFRKNKNNIKSEQLSFRKLVRGDIKFVSVFDKRTRIFEKTNKTLKKYSHIILGGSSEFGLAKETIHTEEKVFIVKRSKKLINQAIKSDHKLLGICFGHHLIAYVQGSIISRPKSQKELGKITVTLNKRAKGDKMFYKTKGRFSALTAHIESITQKSSNIKILAKTNRCKIAAFRIGKNIYGLQFHPELDKENFMERLNLINKDGDDYINYYHVGKTDTANIIKNFLS